MGVVSQPVPRCCHIVPCTDEVTCRRMEKETIARLTVQRAKWERSTWGRLPFHARESYVWRDMLTALGGLNQPTIDKLRALLGDQRFRALLNAGERIGFFISEGSDTDIVVLP